MRSPVTKNLYQVLAGHSGANLVYESAGMHASLLGCCLESYVIDNDMLGAINRTIRGIEVTEDSLSLQAMRDVCIEGPSHFLGHPRRWTDAADYVYPDLGDRNSPKEWNEAGRPDLLENARAGVTQLLSDLAQDTYRRHWTIRSESDFPSDCRLSLGNRPRTEG
ncbi:MAG: hypothetical protein Ct9H300mP16_19620 [Pseudomonadota bacterium]|nr:MAG: hypothetical protein Ct9H300mP16_19620 [Pseudomonadota bacterium]